ncbi:MAG: hypothetical protein PWR23_901 [Peptostreptococcaceae bacterium]|jgi:hypothetical protein|nr:hypothetical protein [Peptostreptococcaceae bacterium]
MQKEYEFIRRFLKLDKDKRIFTLLKDQKITMKAEDLDTAFIKLIEKLDREEGAFGVIPNGGRNDDPYTGLYSDDRIDLPQLASMDRMHVKEDEFDYIFYPEEGRYNGENNKFIYLEGIVYKRLD